MNATRINQLCGSTLPYPPTNAIISTANVFLFRFKSDGSSPNGNGFKATYRAIGNGKLLKCKSIGSDKTSSPHILSNILKSFKIRNRYMHKCIESLRMFLTIGSKAW